MGPFQNTYHLTRLMKQVTGSVYPQDLQEDTISPTSSQASQTHPLFCALLLSTISLSSPWLALALLVREAWHQTVKVPRITYKYFMKKSAVIMPAC